MADFVCLQTQIQSQFVAFGALLLCSVAAGICKWLRATHLTMAVKCQNATKLDEASHGCQWMTLGAAAGTSTFPWLPDFAYDVYKSH